MELDYYDYNVTNAGAAPGSYLGMDPAYLVWIPPLEDLNEFEDIRPKQYIDPGSNQESPEEEISIPRIRRKSISEITAIEASLLETSNSQEIPQPQKRRKSTESNTLLKENHQDTSIETITQAILVAKLEGAELVDFPKKIILDSPVRVHSSCEKETEVEKSPSFDNLDDIKFVDDCDDEVADIVCNKNSYQDSNIIISNDS